MGTDVTPHETAGEDAGEVGGATANKSAFRLRRAVKPGVVLGEELAVLGLSFAGLARQIGVPTSDVSRVVHGQRQLTARFALRLGHWFGTGPEFWMNLQAQYDLALAEAEAGEVVRRLPTKENPLPPRRTGRPRKHPRPVEGRDREVHRASELPTEWVAELEKPVPSYETPLDGLVSEQERSPGADPRERARRAAQTMEELSRGVTLDGLSLRELIGRDRR